MPILLSALLLYFACLYWLAIERIRRWLGLPIRDNCFTAWWREFDYKAGDGFMIHKSRSGWFPHVVGVKGADADPRMQVTLIEFVPLKRVPRLASPPHKFDGYWRRQRFIAI